MASSSSSLRQPRKHSSKDIESGEDTPHSPSPELSSDDDLNIPDDSIDYGKCGIKLAPGRRMGKFLAAELRNSSRQDRTRRMLVYSKYTQKELRKEEQLAKQRFLESIDDDDSEDNKLPFKPKTKGKGKAKGKSKSKAKEKRKKQDDEEDDEEDESVQHKRPVYSTILQQIPTLHPTPSTLLQLPVRMSTTDAEAGARVTATGAGSVVITGTAQASASALISTSGDADVYATARSTGGATSTARAAVRSSGQQSDAATSATINIDTQSVPPSPAKVPSQSSPAKAASQPQVPGPPSPTFPCQNESPCPTPPPLSQSLSRSSQPPYSSAFSSGSASASTSSGSASSHLPAWVNQMQVFLLSSVSDSEWAQSIKTWIELERVYGFVTSRQTLPTELRPDVVTFWTKQARKMSTPPPDVMVAGFNGKVITWWSSMMPSWRTKDANGQWVQSGEGDWGILRCPGLNGFLSVLACLRWWLIQEGATSVSMASAAWRATFEDVCWVMEELRKSEEAPARKKPCSE
ncbi:SERTA domain-containing protein 3 [Paramarasmius palmivorus]|uniref:SERTA domain-containing protein 3 n=1 Tax=Paramarasmius palmivorus TaxID=297713 RepID=A0AAW0AMX8_9AGAR